MCKMDSCVHTPTAVHLLAHHTKLVQYRNVHSIESILSFVPDQYVMCFTASISSGIIDDEFVSIFLSSFLSRATLNSRATKRLLGPFQLAKLHSDLCSHFSTKFCSRIHRTARSQ